MPRKCPPGVFCIENMTLVFIIFSVALGIYLFYKFNAPKGPNTVIYQNAQPRPSIFPPSKMDERRARSAGLTVPVYPKTSHCTHYDPKGEYYTKSD